MCINSQFCSYKSHCKAVRTKWSNVGVQSCLSAILFQLPALRDMQCQVLTEIYSKREIFFRHYSLDPQLIYLFMSCLSDLSPMWFTLEEVFYLTHNCKTSGFLFLQGLIFVPLTADWNELFILEYARVPPLSAFFIKILCGFVFQVASLSSSFLLPFYYFPISFSILSSFFPPLLN